jgi:hypothetical protein
MNPDFQDFTDFYFSIGAVGAICVLNCGCFENANDRRLNKRKISHFQTEQSIVSES